jgi:TolA-binding protein
LRDPARAARLFRRALALEPSGPLAEEALWGIAEAHRRLRHRTAEQAALREFLERHPNGASAPQARQRLEQLAR